jgi:hypothetical protein
MSESERKQSKLHEMVVRGTNFKEDYEFELYGEDVTVILQPLVDDEFIPLAAFLSEHLDLDEEEERDKAVSKSIDKIEEAKDEADEGEPIDMSKMDKEFVAAMQEAAKYGIYGGYDENGDEVEHTDEEVEYIVDQMMGGTSIELGGHVLEISGDVRDAEKFRGGRGSVEHSRDS